MHSMQFNIRISSNCINCIRCVAVCPSHVLVRNSANRMVEVGSLGRCIGCGQCAAVCPTHALHHSAYPTEKIHPFKTEDCPTSEQFLLLCKKRRSNRTFSGQPVPKECSQKIMEAGSYAPTAHNAQDVCYKVINSASQLQILSRFVADSYKHIIHILQNPLLKPFLRRFRPQYYDNLPSMLNVVAEYDKGNDIILRKARTVILICTDQRDFFGATNADLAYQNMSLMAETLGVSQFYAGFLCSAIRLKKGGLEQLLGIKGKIHAAMALGIPKVKFNNYVERPLRFEFI